MTGLGAEIRATLALAVPLAAANLSQMAMGVTDTVMVGGLGAVPLAAVGLGGGVYFTSVVICQGVLTAVAPLAAYKIGAGDREAAGRIAGSGLVLAVLLAVPVVAAMLTADRLLGRVGYDPALADEIVRFLRAVAWGAPGFIAFAVLRSLFSALGKTRAVMLVLALCVPVNVLLNWVLIFGHFGAAPLGVVGSGYASATTEWLMCLGLAAALWRLRRQGRAPRLRGELRVVGLDIRRILLLGLPIGGLQALEVGVFVVSAFLMGFFGADALAAHQIAINFASATFMVPLGISQAATVRVAADRGTGSSRGARRAAYVALGLGAGFMTLSALAIWSMPRAIIGAYVAVGDPANQVLVALAGRFLLIAAIFQIADGVQVVAVGGLRGYEDTAVPMLLAAIGYWGIGFAGGWALAFHAGLGPTGLWWGFVLGLATVAVLLLLRLARRARRVQVI